MRLKSFHVKVFRNIIDSGPVAVDDVTCVVGKNEAGKSALLHALHHLNPAKPPVTLDLLDEYPRWLKKEHEITGEIEQAVPISATYELTDAEAKALDDQFGAGVVTSREVVVERIYGAKDANVSVQIDLAAFLATSVAALPGRLQPLVKDAKNSSELLKALDGAVAARDEEDATSVAVASDAEAARAKLNEQLGGASSLTSAVQAHVRSRLPRTFYFSTYSQLRGRYDLAEVFAAVKKGSNDESLQAAADFLTLARVVPDTIEEWDFEASNAELEAVSSLLTKRVKDHWKQNDHLKLKVTLEAQRESAPAGGETIHRFLQFRVEDTRHDFSSRLDRRSTGFQWFVSFLASFLEFEKDKDLILLLDEPGLSLHARAQMDLLDTVESKLAQDRQVLYSTHSPFMVKPASLAHTRIAEDQGPEIGSVVLNDAGVVTDPDTLFPLQAALGYDIAQTLFVGNRNIVVEGISDFLYLSAVSAHLEALGRTALPEDCRLLPAGGASNIPTFLALLGTQLDVVVLVDGSTETQRIENSIVRGRLARSRIVSVASHCKVARADIEDLFTPAEYLTLYNAAFGKSLKVADLDGSDRIVLRIARSEGSDFNHGVVAAHFLATLDASVKALSAGTLDRFESLIVALVTALPAA